MTKSPRHSQLVLVVDLILPRDARAGVPTLLREFNVPLVGQHGQLGARLAGSPRGRTGFPVEAGIG